jgi:hypothetical protein
VPVLIPLVTRLRWLGRTWYRVVKGNAARVPCGYFSRVYNRRVAFIVVYPGELHLPHAVRGIFYERGGYFGAYYCISKRTLLYVQELISHVVRFTMNSLGATATDGAVSATPFPVGRGLCPCRRHPVRKATWFAETRWWTRLAHFLFAGVGRRDPCLRIESEVRLTDIHGNRISPTWAPAIARYVRCL